MSRLAAGRLAELSLALLYFASGVLFIYLSRQPGSVAQLWFGNAIALAFLLRAPGRPIAMLAAAFAGGLGANLSMGTALLPSLGFMAANLVEIGTAFALARTWEQGSDIDGDVWAYLRILAAAALAGPLVGGALGALTVQVAFGGPFVASYLGWVEGAAVGAIGVLPVALLLSRGNLMAMVRTVPLRQAAIIAAVTVGSVAMAQILPGRPLLIIGIPVLLASVWSHSLVAALTVLGSLVATLLAETLAHDASDIGSLMTVAAIALVAPFCVALVMQRLREERSRYVQSARSSAVGMADVALDGTWRFANRALREFLGYDRDEVERIEWESIVHPDDLEQFLVEHRKLVGGLTNAIRMVARFMRRDGAVVWGDIVGSVVRDEVSGEPRHLFFQILDVTGRREAERALADSEERLTFALESGGLGVRDYDFESGETYNSPAWNRLFGRPEEETANTGTDAWSEMVHPDDVDRILSIREEVKAGKRSGFSEVYRMRHAGGAWLWIHNTVRVMGRIVDGRPQRIVGLYRDVTIEHEARRAVEESEKRWAFALESARQGVWDARIDEGKTFYSDMWKAMLGYAVDEIPDEVDAWKSFVHPDDRDVVEHANLDALEVGGYFEMEFRMRHKDGHWLWILDRGKVVDRDAEGLPLRMIGTHTDITDRRESEERLRKLSQRIQLATRAGGVGLWEYDAETDEVWWDDRMHGLYGIPEGVEATPELRVNARHPEDRDRVQRDLADALAGKRPYETEFRIVLPDGKVRHLRSMAEIVRDEHGKVRLLRGTSYDVTETRRLTAALAEEKERLRVTLESIGDGVITTDTEGRVTFLNKVAELETGWLAAEAAARPLDDVFRLIDEWSEHAAPNPVQACLETGKPAEAQDEVILIDRAGGRKDVRNTAAPILDETGHLIGAVLVFQDISRARRLQRQLSYSATHDALTGLRNRAAFERDLKSFVDETLDATDQHALCFIDLDRFKEVNDTAGHAAGDELLRAIARAIREQIRTVDVAARLGGDEFALLLRGCPIDDALTVCEKVRRAIEEFDFSFEGRAFGVGASIGIAPIDGSLSPSEVLSAADTACYAAKAAGRNSVRVFDGEVGPKAAAG